MQRIDQTCLKLFVVGWVLLVVGRAIPFGISEGKHDNKTVTNVASATAWLGDGKKKRVQTKMQGVVRRGRSMILLELLRTRSTNS